MKDLIKRIISELTIAISNCQLYSKDHELINDHSKGLHKYIHEFQDERVEIMLIEDGLVVNRLPVRDAGLHGSKFVRYLKRKGISSIIIAKGVQVSELMEFIIDLSSPDTKLRKYRDIKTGIVDLNIEERRGGDSKDTESIEKEILQRVQEIFNSISPFKMLRVAGIEELVNNFMVTFMKETGILRLLKPVSDGSDASEAPEGGRPSNHSINVSILSMFIAESLGLKERVVHDIGVSALLHDVGKLFISGDVSAHEEQIREAPSVYTQEAAELMRHPIYGAIYLSKAEGLTRLAPVVAFQHHMRYDGSGYPPSRMGKGRQHLSSQIVAIADFFDSLRSTRLYQRSWEIKDILVVMRMNAGREFNPFLVDNFARAILMMGGIRA